MQVDLRKSPRGRWTLTAVEAASARELLQTYRADLGISSTAASRLTAFARNLIPQDYWQELESLAENIAIPFDDIVLYNLYYDALKVLLDDAGRQLLGCTAFAIEHPTDTSFMRATSTGGATATPSPPIPPSHSSKMHLRETSPLSAGQASTAS
jgi:hypothetical protein